MNKNQEQAIEAELSLLESYLHSSSTLSSKIIRGYSKKCTKNKCVCFNDIITENENEAEN